MSSTKFKQGVRRPNPRAHNKTELSIIDTALRSGRIDVEEEFREQPMFTDGDGLSAPGTTGVNLMKTEQHAFEVNLLGTATTGVPVWSAADGLDIAIDNQDAEGAEYTLGIGARSKRAYVVGTDKRFFVEAALLVTDVSGLAELAVGFRKAEAYQALIDNYDEMACLNVQGGDVKIETILNNAATATTDTTVDVADAGTVVLRVEVGSNGQCAFYINGTKTSVAQFKFDAGEIVIPFLHFLNAADLAGPIYCTSFRVGSL